MANQEIRTFSPSEGPSAMYFDIDRSGRGATISVERTEDRGWKSIASYEDEARVEFFGNLNERGFGGYHTGGGCRAMARHFGEGAHAFQILLTGEDVDLPEPDGEWLIGCYDPDGDPIGEYASGSGNAELFKALDAAIERIEKHIASETPEQRAKREAEYQRLLASFPRY